jgi:hypothetical protein
MIFRVPTVPSDGIDVVREGLGRFSAPDTAIIAGSARHTADESPRIDHPHPVYELDAQAVAGGGTLDTARLTGFRYVVEEGAGPASFAELRVDAADPAPRMTMRGYGLYAEALIGGLAQVEKLPAVAAGSYELRVLRCSAIYLVALWLRGEQGAPDIVYALAPAPQGIEPGHPYSADEFMKIVRPLVQARTTAFAAL